MVSDNTVVFISCSLLSFLITLNPKLCSKLHLQSACKSYPNPKPKLLISTHVILTHKPWAIRWRGARKQAQGFLSLAEACPRKLAGQGSRLKIEEGQGPGFRISDEGFRVKGSVIEQSRSKWETTWNINGNWNCAKVARDFWGYISP